jgi:hypothetical protein
MEGSEIMFSKKRLRILERGAKKTQANAWGLKMTMVSFSWL